MGKKKQAILDDEPLFKSDDEDEDDVEEMDGEEMDDEDVGDEEMDDEEEDDTEKSGHLDESDLSKALDELESVAMSQTQGISSRQRALAARVARGERLNKSEREELASFDDDEMEKSHREEFMSNSKMAQGFEVSDFLDALASKVADSLDSNRSQMRKSFDELAEFNHALAKSFKELGATVVELKRENAALKELIGEGARPQPMFKSEAAPAKGMTNSNSLVGTKLNKSGGNKNTNLSKAVILDTLDDLIAKGGPSSKDGFHGVDLVFQATRYESTGELAPEAMRMVCEARGIDPATLGL